MVKNVVKLLKLIFEELFKCCHGHVKNHVINRETEYGYIVMNTLSVLNL